MTHSFTSLVDILQYRAKAQPGQLAYRYLLDGEHEEVCMTYEELDRRACAIASLVQSSAKEGDRALLIFSPGLDFIAAYFGCLYAKVLAIPVYAPHPARLEKNLPIILRIAADARPAVALLTVSLFDVIRSRKEIAGQFGDIELLATDNDDINDRAGQWEQTPVDKNDLAFLQYTSGSTTIPKGVMVSHGNLMHNLDFIEGSFGLSAKSHTVFWLPPYHDMGLIGGILQALYTGYPVTLIPHLLFLQRPVRWLQAISRFGATCSGGPNFAYDLCVRKIKPEQKEQLDLSSWEVAFNGAEPVYHKTLDQFANYFASCGFRREAFLPCYGLAEATLMVAGGPKSRLPLLQCLVNSKLSQHQVIVADDGNRDCRTLVSCGQSMPGQKIRIVNAETLMPCLPDEIGEIWVSGASITGGYWNKPLETERIFRALLPGHEEPYLRTGDLGFLQEEELYITGRLKNLIISNGKNHYSHDIERTVEISHPAIRPAGCAVFSIIDAADERIVIIAEIEHKLIVHAAEIMKAIRDAVVMQHELYVDDIKLTSPGDIPRTTSGKIRHFLCKTSYMDGAFKEIKSA